MSQPPLAQHRSPASPRCLAALDFGLRVRVRVFSQRPLFSTSDNLSLQQDASELSLMVSDLRVRSFAVRHQLEQVTTALVCNVQCGFWALARRSALDLADLLTHSRRRRLADAELCAWGAQSAQRIASLCGGDVR